MQCVWCQRARDLLPGALSEWPANFVCASRILDVEEQALRARREACTGELGIAVDVLGEVEEIPLAAETPKKPSAKPP